MKTSFHLTAGVFVTSALLFANSVFAEDLSALLMQRLTDHTEQLYSYQLQKGIRADITLDTLSGVQDESGVPMSIEADTRLAYRGGKTVKCESQSNRYNYCYTNTTGRVRLDRQLSDTPCRQYSTWGADGDGSGIWVRNGCRAIFVVASGWGGGGGGGGGRTITCKSKGWEYNHCSVNLRGQRVRLGRQISGTRCIRGDNWGTDRGGIWVDRGCAAQFYIE